MSYSLYKCRFELDEREKNWLYNKIVGEHLYLKQREDYLNYSPNFPLTSEEYQSFSNKVQSFFIDQCKSIYGNFNITSVNYCFAYVSNIRDYNSKLNGIHDHIKTSSVNGVYYLNVPCDKSGKITFHNNDLDQILEYQPKTFDFLIMPNFFKHYPRRSYSFEYRIAINVEVMSDNLSFA